MAFWVAQHSRDWPVHPHPQPIPARGSTLMQVIAPHPRFNPYATLFSPLLLSLLSSPLLSFAFIILFSSPLSLSSLLSFFILNFCAFFLLLPRVLPHLLPLFLFTPSSIIYLPMEEHQGLPSLSKDFPLPSSSIILPPFHAVYSHIHAPKLFYPFLLQSPSPHCFTSQSYPPIPPQSMAMIMGMPGVAPQGLPPLSPSSPNMLLHFIPTDEPSNNVRGFIKTYHDSAKKLCIFSSNLPVGRV